MITAQERIMLMSRIRVTSFKCFFVKTNITRSIAMYNGITDIPYNEYISAYIQLVQLTGRNFSRHLTVTHFNNTIFIAPLIQTYLTNKSAFYTMIHEELSTTNNLPLIYLNFFICNVYMKYRFE